MDEQLVVYYSRSSAAPAEPPGDGGLESLLGNPAWQRVFRLMLDAHSKARLTGYPALIEAGGRRIAGELERVSLNFIRALDRYRS